jgi:hypothetical protein
LDTAAPEFAGAKDHSREIFIDRDKTLLAEGIVAIGKIQGVDTHMRVVSIRKSNANAIAVHNPASAGHSGSEKVSKVKCCISTLSREILQICVVCARSSREMTVESI